MRSKKIVKTHKMFFSINTVSLYSRKGKFNLLLLLPCISFFVLMAYKKCLLALIISDNENRGQK